MPVSVPQEQTSPVKPEKDSPDRPLPHFKQPQPYIDADSDFERMDRGLGWGIDDEPTYHRTEK